MEVILILGALMGLAGAIWIAVIAFQDGEIGWGVGCLICGIVTLIYGIQNIDRCGIPLGLFVIGIIVRVGGAAALAQSGGF